MTASGGCDISDRRDDEHRIGVPSLHRDDVEAGGGFEAVSWVTRGNSLAMAVAAIHESLTPMLRPAWRSWATRPAHASATAFVDGEWLEAADQFERPHPAMANRRVIGHQHAPAQFPDSDDGHREFFGGAIAERPAGLVGDEH